MSDANSQLSDQKESVAESNASDTKNESENESEKLDQSDSNINSKSEKIGSDKETKEQSESNISDKISKSDSHDSIISDANPEFKSDLNSTAKSEFDMSNDFDESEPPIKNNESEKEKSDLNSSLNNESVFQSDKNGLTSEKSEKDDAVGKFEEAAGEIAGILFGDKKNENENENKEKEKENIPSEDDQMKSDVSERKMPESESADIDENGMTNEKTSEKEEHEKKESEKEDSNHENSNNDNFDNESEKSEKEESGKSESEKGKPEKDDSNQESSEKEDSEKEYSDKSESDKLKSQNKEESAKGNQSEKDISEKGTSDKESPDVTSNKEEKDIDKESEQSENVKESSEKGESENQKSNDSDSNTEESEKKSDNEKSESGKEKEAKKSDSSDSESDKKDEVSSKENKSDSDSNKEKIEADNDENDFISQDGETNAKANSNEDIIIKTRSLPDQKSDTNEHNNLEQEDIPKNEESVSGNPTTDSIFNSIANNLNNTTEIIDNCSQTDPCPMTASCQTPPLPKETPNQFSPSSASSSDPPSPPQMLERSFDQQPEKNQDEQNDNLSEFTDEHQGKSRAMSEHELMIYYNSLNCRCSQSRRLDRTLPKATGTRKNVQSRAIKRPTTSHSSTMPRNALSRPTTAPSRTRDMDNTQPVTPLLHQKNHESLTPDNSSKSELPSIKNESTPSNNASSKSKNSRATKNIYSQGGGTSPYPYDKLNKTTPNRSNNSRNSRITSVVSSQRASASSSMRNSPNSSARSPSSPSNRRGVNYSMNSASPSNSTSNSPLNHPRKTRTDPNEPKIIKKKDLNGNTAEIHFVDGDTSTISIAQYDTSTNPTTASPSTHESTRVSGNTTSNTSPPSTSRSSVKNDDYEQMIDDVLNYTYPPPDEAPGLLNYVKNEQVNSIVNEDYANADRYRTAETILVNSPTRSRAIDEHYQSIESRLYQAENELEEMKQHYAERLAEFEEHCQAKMEKIGETHQTEEEAFEEEWGCERATIPFDKASPFLLDLRHRQKVCALTKDFSAANARKREADMIQEVEEQNALYRAEASMKAAHQQMIEKHVIQIQCAEENWQRQRHFIEKTRDHDIKTQELLVQQLRAKREEKYEVRARCHNLSDRTFDSNPVSPRTMKSFNDYRKNTTQSKLKLNSRDIIQSLHPNKAPTRPFTPGKTKRYGGYC